MNTFFDKAHCKFLVSAIRSAIVETLAVISIFFFCGEMAMFVEMFRNS